MGVPDDFYGEPSYWFMILSGVFGLDIVMSNGLLLWIAGTTVEIRSVPANLFTINLAVGNILVGSFYAFLQPFVLVFGEQIPVLCKICGFGNLFFAMCFLFTPTLMAACKFYNVTQMPSSTVNWFISRAFFEKSGALLLLAVFWFYGLIFCLFLLFVDQLGEDPNGFCAAKAFTSPLLYIIYNLALIFFALTTSSLTFLYFNRLRRFLDQNSRNSSDQNAKDIRGVMRLVAITAIMPLLCNSPTLILTGGQWFVPDILPIWSRRLLVLPVFLPSMADPWLTMLLLRPFRKQFNQKIVAKIVRQPTSTVTIIQNVQQSNDIAGRRTISLQKVTRNSVAVFTLAGRRISVH